MNKKLLISIILPFFTFLLFFSFSNSSNAVSCGARSAIGSTPPYWGNDPAQNVIVSVNSQARISIKGEDGCAGQPAEIQILKDSNIVRTVTLTLNLGAPVTGQQNVHVLYADGTIDFSPGVYRAKFIRVGNIVGSSAQTSNTLTVQAQTQACTLSRLTTNPIGGVRGGQQIQLIIEALGTCQDWGATVNVLGSSNICNFNGSEQKFSSGSNRLVWNFTPSNPTGPQAVCRFRASLGSQSSESSTFTIQRVGSNPAPGPGNPSPGEPVDISFKIPNPIQAESLIDLAKAIGRFLFQIAIPIAVIVIIYAGLLFLTSRGDKEKITTARKALWYAVIGLAIILIGQGFFTLIKSILDLGTP
ncbi:MAG: hypothetical protein AAB338_01495 [Patescibacteria group bacterium]